MSWWRNRGVTLKVGCPATEIDIGRREIKTAAFRLQKSALIKRKAVSLPSHG
jgi:hypothetical protein